MLQFLYLCVNASGRKFATVLLVINDMIKSLCRIEVLYVSDEILFPKVSDEILFPENFVLEIVRKFNQALLGLFWKT